MIARITREIRRDGLTADIRNSIVAAIESVEHRRFWFNEGEATATASAGDYHVTIPLAFIEADEVYYEDSASARWPLTLQPWEDITLRDRSNNGRPTDYAIHHDAMHVYPVPDGNYLIRINGIHELTEISASASAGSANAWTQEAEQLIRPLAKADLFAGRLRNDSEAAKQLAIAATALQRLLQRTSQQISSGRIKKTQF